MQILVHGTTKCVDDPTGSLTSFGGCDDLFDAAGCDTDLNTLNSAIPVGSFLKNICPVKCSTCASFDPPIPTGIKSDICTYDPAMLDKMDIIDFKAMGLSMTEPPRLAKRRAKTPQK